MVNTYIKGPTTSTPEKVQTKAGRYQIPRFFSETSRDLRNVSETETETGPGKFPEPPQDRCGRDQDETEIGLGLGLETETGITLWHNFPQREDFVEGVYG